MRTMVYLLSCLLIPSWGCAHVRTVPVTACMHAAGNSHGTPTVEPPGTVTFDDVEITKVNPPTYFGTLTHVHTSTCDCLATEKEGRWWRRHEVRSPCVLECLEVFAEIPTYREIMRRGLRRDEDMDYWHLVSQANETFHSAVAATIRELKLYDVVLPYGTLRLREGSAARGIPDITHEVIKRVKP